MILYTCGTKKMGPGFAHPCAKAGKALDAAGYEYELKTVGGYRLMPWTWGSRERGPGRDQEAERHPRGADPGPRRRRGDLRLQHDRALGQGAPALAGEVRLAEPLLRSQLRLTKRPPSAGDQRADQAAADHDDRPAASLSKRVLELDRSAAFTSDRTAESMRLEPLVHRASSRRSICSKRRSTRSNLLRRPGEAFIDPAVQVVQPVVAPALPHRLHDGESLRQKVSRVTR